MQKQSKKQGQSWISDRAVPRCGLAHTSIAESQFRQKRLIWGRKVGEIGSGWESGSVGLLTLRCCTSLVRPLTRPCRRTRSCLSLLHSALSWFLPSLSWPLTLSISLCSSCTSPAEKQCKQFSIRANIIVTSGLTNKTLLSAN